MADATGRSPTLAFTGGPSVRGRRSTSMRGSDVVTQDRMWFEINKSAVVRYRVATDWELAQLAELGLFDHPMPPPPGYEWRFYMEVRRVADGVRARCPHIVA